MNRSQYAGFCNDPAYHHHPGICQCARAPIRKPIAGSEDHERRGCVLVFDGDDHHSRLWRLLSGNHRGAYHRHVHHVCRSWHIGALASILASVLVGSPSAPAEAEAPGMAQAPAVEQELATINNELAALASCWRKCRIKAVRMTECRHGLEEEFTDVIMPIRPGPAAVHKSTVGIFVFTTPRLDHAIQCDELRNDNFSHISCYTLLNLKLIVPSEDPA